MTMNRGANTDPVWTTRRLLAWTTEYLARREVDSPRLSAEMLLSHVLGVARLKLYMDSDRPASELERGAFRELVERAGRHEPVDYLVGQSPFMSLMFEVNPSVLIPRPSTETLVEHILQHQRRTPGFSNPLIFDICTGSGCIAVSLAKQMPGCRVVATDISAAALEIARRNAAAHGVSERVEFREGNLWKPLAGEGMRARYIASNPPYISDKEWEEVAPNVKNYEPTLALRGGEDGLKYIRELLAQAPQFLDHPGQLLVEIAASQKQAVLDLAKETPGLANARVLADHEGLPRVLVAESV